MVSILSSIVDATNRPSFYGYGGYDVPPLTLGLSSYFGYGPVSAPSFGWTVPSLWGWGSPMSRFGDEWLAYDVFDAGVRLLGWGNALTETDPFLHPYVWNNLMWRNYFPSGLPFPWVPPLYNPWAASQSYGGQAPVSAPSSHVTMNGRGAQPPPRTNGEPPPTEDYLEPPPSEGEAPPPPRSGRSGRRGGAHRPSGSGAAGGAGAAPPPNRPTDNGVHLGQPLTANHVQPFKRSLGGEIYQVTDPRSGTPVWVLVKEEKAFLMTKVDFRNSTAELKEIGSVRDGKLYPTQ